MASNIYPNIIVLALKGDVDFDTAVVKVALCAADMAFDADHTMMNQVTHELTVAGYARVEADNIAVTLDTSNNRCKIDGDDVTFTSLTAGETEICAIVYVHVGANDAANPLIAYVDTADIATNGGNIVVTWNTAGIITVA